MAVQSICASATWILDIALVMGFDKSNVCIVEPVGLFGKDGNVFFNKTANLQVAEINLK